MEKEEKNRKKTGAGEKSEKRYELSEEAKLGPDEKKHIKDLGNGKAIVSSKPKFKSDENPDVERSAVKREENSEEIIDEPKEESLQEKTEQMLENTGKESKELEQEQRNPEKAKKVASEKKTPTKTKKKKRKNTTSQKKPKLTVSNLVSLLASYKVPLDASVRKLIKEIKGKGESHLKKELNK